MEVTNLDRLEDDGLMEQPMLDRLPGGEDVGPAEIEAVRREATMFRLEGGSAAFRPLAAELPVNLN